MSMPGVVRSFSMPSLPFSAETHLHLVGLEHAGHREDVADVVVDDQHLAAGQHRRRRDSSRSSVSRPSVGSWSTVHVQQQRHVVEEPFGRLRDAHRPRSAWRRRSLPQLARQTGRRVHRQRRGRLGRQRVEGPQSASAASDDQAIVGRLAEPLTCLGRRSRRRRARRRDPPNRRRSVSAALAVEHHQRARRLAAGHPARSSRRPTSSCSRVCTGLFSTPTAPSEKLRSRSSSVVMTKTGMWRVSRSCFRRSSTRQPSRSGSEMSSVMASGWRSRASASARGAEGRRQHLVAVVVRQIDHHAGERRGRCRRPAARGPAGRPRRGRRRAAARQRADDVDRLVAADGGGAGAELGEHRRALARRAVFE